ncbi:MAG TPA: SIS domain-containing protein [Lacunisphaera sp.]|jgi:D-sedoheptulose 7-phosphate isomerase
MSDIQKLAADYFSRLHQMLAGVDTSAIARVADALHVAWKEGRTVYVAGNGGSAATASHMACDLSKGTAAPNRNRLRVISLADNVAWLTAIGNDIDYHSIFTEPLENQFRADDVLMVISASGNSPNIVKAVEWANAHSGKTIAFCGFTGGRIHEIAHISVHLPSNDYGPVEDGHLILNHILVEYLRAKIHAS